MLDLVSAGIILLLYAILCSLFFVSNLRRDIARHKLRSSVYFILKGS